MGFNIFISVCNLLIPLTMLGFGLYFSKHAPKKINPVFGYRTRMSMKNDDTWTFAHHHCGKTWRVAGAVLLAVSATVNVFLFRLSENGTMVLFSILCLVQLVFLIGSIFPTEKALKKTFDENGNRRA